MILGLFYSHSLNSKYVRDPSFSTSYSLYASSAISAIFSAPEPVLLCTELLRRLLLSRVGIDDGVEKLKLSMPDLRLSLMLSSASDIVSTMVLCNMVTSSLLCILLSPCKSNIENRKPYFSSSVLLVQILKPVMNSSKSRLFDCFSSNLLNRRSPQRPGKGKN